MIKLGSLFSGIGGFELGLERALPQCKTIWQVEQDKFCQSILRKHWADTIIYDDVRTVGAHNLESVDVLCGGFPCQSISHNGKMEGLKNENKSGLWYEMCRIIGEMRPRLVILENVHNVRNIAGHTVLRNLAKMGYDSEWGIVQANWFGLPHVRRRWFCIAYTPGTCKQQPTHPQCLETKHRTLCSLLQSIRDDTERMYRKQIQNESPVCRGSDGIPKRMDRCKALGNSIVPACSEFIGQVILQSGLVDDLIQ